MWSTWTFIKALIADNSVELFLCLLFALFYINHGQIIETHVKKIPSLRAEVRLFAPFEYIFGNYKTIMGFFKTWLTPTNLPFSFFFVVSKYVYWTELCTKRQIFVTYLIK